ncbi:MAG TPA: D-alanyl-D-alanine carboxypeptidase/D-alanyl-D-alanine-endopeptidase [Gemmatales bacterium]|nr:D-alanyl-D-alanine carboxypeptidase/D-alanyl-D-alanine-endopeptidase [Gemmatales bacterium]
MLSLFRAAAIALSLCLVLSASGQDTGKPKLSETIKGVIDQPKYKTAHWGLYVVDARSGDVLLDHQSEKLFAPASCTKLFSVAAAFDQLGADYRFHTRLLHTGKLDEETKVLKGNLILLASGDLTMGGRTLPDGTIAFKDNDHTYANGGIKGQLTDVDPLTGLNQIAKQIAEKVKSIEGDVLIDDRLFEKAEGSGSGPGKLTPIIINDNVIDFVITPHAEKGKLAKVVHRPQGSAIQVDAQVETISENQLVMGRNEGTPWRKNKPSITISSPSPGRYVVRGEMPANHTPLVRVREVDDAASHARSLLIDALERAGVKVKASTLGSQSMESLPTSEAVGQLPMVTELVSAPLSEHARLILKVSHNLHASTLPLIVAAHHHQKSLVQGLKHQGASLKKLGVPMEGVSFGGGAGGSRSDYASPKATVALLQAMAKRPDGAAYRHALPIVGVDGTPAGAVNADSPAKGKFQAKTGTLTWNNGLTSNDLMTSKALSGYGETASGRQVTFAFFVNNVPVGEDGTSQAGRDLGKLCELVYRSE